MIIESQCTYVKKKKERGRKREERRDVEKTLKMSLGE